MPIRGLDQCSKDPGTVGCQGLWPERRGDGGERVPPGATGQFPGPGGVPIACFKFFVASSALRSPWPLLVAGPILARAQFLQLLELLGDPSPLVGPLQQKVTMPGVQLLRELHALLGVASALRSVHRRHHLFEQVFPSGCTKTMRSGRVPKGKPKFPSRNREPTIGCGI
jgi:hypothetical protein